ncbi:MAG: hypothetical protein KC451_04935 [Amylibacter sp.]|nr:hypothetical protein [Amylibacter sp.]
MMFKTSLIFLTFGLGVAFATSAISAQKIPVSAAIAQCKKQNGWYQGDGGLAASGQSHNETHFRTCVFVKSGKYPPAERKSGLTISGSARIGIVVN